MNKKKLYISNLGWQHKDFSKVEKLISINNFAGIDLAPMAIWKDWNKIEKKSVKFFNYLSSKKISVNALQGVFYKKNFNLFKDYKFKMVDIINHMHLIIKLCKIFKLPSPPIPIKASSSSFLKLSIIILDASTRFPFFSTTPNGFPLLLEPKKVPPILIKLPSKLEGFS